MTQSELAKRLHVTPQGVSNWELGLSCPDLQNLCNIAECFNASIDALFSENCGNDTRVMVGVDGGGTKTEFVLFDEQGHILHRILLGPSNPNDIGTEKSISLLCDGLDVLFGMRSKIECVFLGIAGCGAGKHKQVLLHRISERYSKTKIFLDSDVISAFALGGFHDKGMVLISGTGSVLFARDGESFHRVGGWGYLFDSAGSAYDIGRDAIASVLAFKDNLGKQTCLSELVAERLGGDSWENLDKIYTGGKSYIASFAHAVFCACERGDEVASEIIAKNGKRLSELIGTAVGSYDCGSTVLLCGGIFENYTDMILPHIKENLKTDIKFIKASLPPVFGACLVASERAKTETDENFEETFLNDYNKLISKGANV